ncbi:MAG: hypothetical protein ABI460_17110, partial [Caldimonas sp.]
MALALFLSLLAHALLLSLSFNGQELGLPGFAFPWQDRRAEAPELRVVLVPPPVAAAPAAPPIAAPLPSAPSKPPGPAVRRDMPSASTSKPLRQTADAIAPKADRTAEAEPPHDLAAGPADAGTPLRTDVPSDVAPASIPEPSVIALERPDDAAVVVPPPPPVAPAVVAAAPSASSPEQLEAARIEAARLEAEREESARQAA